MLTKRTRVTGRHVAEAAGVSQKTVSLVMHDHPSISAETKARVRAASAALGYQPNAAAAHLASARSHVLGFLLFRGEEEPNEAVAIIDVFRNQLLTASTGRARAGGYYLLLDTFVDAAHCLALVDSGRIDGALVDMMVSDDLIAQLVARAVPLVMIGRRPQLPVSAVLADEEGGAYTLGRHLLGLGHRRLAIIGVREANDSAPAQERVRGFRRALAEAGITPAPTETLPGDWSFESGYLWGQRLLTQPEPPSAIFALAEQMAVGVLEATHDLGVRVPDDLAVVTTEDSRWVEHVRPALTAVHVPMFEVGLHATQLLLARLADPALPPEQVVVPTQVIVRESSRPRQPGRQTGPAALHETSMPDVGL